VGVPLYLVRAEVPFAPLHEHQLSNDERKDEDEYHLGVHRLVTAVFLMHTSVFHSATQHNANCHVPSIKDQGQTDR